MIIKPSIIRIVIFKYTPFILLGFAPLLFFVGSPLHDPGAYWDAAGNYVLGWLVGGISMSFIYSYLTAIKYEIEIYSDFLMVLDTDLRKMVRVEIDKIRRVEYKGMPRRIVIHEIGGLKGIIPASLYRDCDISRVNAILDRSHNKSRHS